MLGGLGGRWVLVGLGLTLVGFGVLVGVKVGVGVGLEGGFNALVGAGVAEVEKVGRMAGSSVPAGISPPPSFEV